MNETRERAAIESRRGGFGLGVALVALGVYALLKRSFHIEGPGPILLVIGAALFAIAALRRFQGPLVPAGVLLGLGTAFLVRDPLEPWVPGWATILFGIGAGLLLASALGRREGRRGPSVAGVVLVAIALFAVLSTNLHLSIDLYDRLWRLWPFALVGAGILLVFQALAARRAR
ncbi:MAG TPA: hypothetical protein VMH79_16865 [Thermoanaerobaculia bacterium]|nr:hypothetical protein [Thermoanaerobaculia bacterium]